MLWIHNTQRGYSFWGKSISQQPLTDRTAPLTMYLFMHLTPYLSAVSFLNVSFKQLQCKSPITYFCLLLQHLICLISRNALPVPALNPEPFPHISNKKTTPPKKTAVVMAPCTHWTQELERLKSANIGGATAGTSLMFGRCSPQILYCQRKLP